MLMAVKKRRHLRAQRAKATKLQSFWRGSCVRLRMRRELFARKTAAAKMMQARTLPARAVRAPAHVRVL
jgi:hypothetical protein